MARTFTPEVNRHVLYFVTVGGKSKWVSATITGVVNSTTVNVRVGRHTTGSNRVKQPYSKPLVATQWRPA